VQNAHQAFLDRANAQLGVSFTRVLFCFRPEFNPPLLDRNETCWLQLIGSGDVSIVAENVDAGAKKE
jgi:hypothetical protein